MYIGVKLIEAVPMNRAEYNIYRGWELPLNENGEDEGYLVEYLDGGQANHPDHKGYISWSPSAVFENSYRKIDSLTFGLAIEAMKKGKKVSRKGWNGKGLHLELQLPDEHSKMTLPYIFLQYPATKASETAPENHMNARVPWLASQTDLLAEDWTIVD